MDTVIRDWFSMQMTIEFKYNDNYKNIYDLYTR